MRTLLSICHLIFAVRCILYAVLPRSYPFTVLIVEPLHGITFAMMWSVSVEYGKRIAPIGSEATMQALLSGLYYKLAIGIGSSFWGVVTAQRHLGFRKSYFACACLQIVWSLFWNAGWVLESRMTNSLTATMLNSNRPSSRLPIV